MKITKDYLLGFTEGLITEYNENVYPIEKCNTFYLDVSLVFNHAEIFIGYSLSSDDDINIEKIVVDEQTENCQLQECVIDVCIKIENYITNGNY